ncbi:MAG: YihY/virulence factor BrkB family protein [Desulfobulbus sp.]|nr:YihY/virulence factor BrkB family protein [Desulfobulbus sp.]
MLLVIYQEFFNNHIPMRAAALTFSIILSMVPILALSTSVLKGLGSDQQLKVGIIQLIDQWEPQDRSEDGDKQKTAQDQTDPPPAVLHQAVHFIFAYVDRTNFATLGALGVFSLLLTTFFVFSSIEEALNTIWHTTQHRSWHRKIVDYFALLFFLPLSFNLAFALEAVLTSANIMHRLNQIFPNVLVQLFFFHLVPFIFIVSSLMLLYLFVPSKRVLPWAAFTGAGVASSLWLILQKLYFFLQIGVSNYNIIYGSFASIPLFLIWLYIGWISILFGALLTYTLQHRLHHQCGSKPLTPRKCIELSFDILFTCYANFNRRIPTTQNTLQKQLPASSPSDIQSVLHQLKQGGYVTTSMAADQQIFIPCTAADQLMASEVLLYLLGGQSHTDTTQGEHLATCLFTDLQASSSLPFSHFLRRNDYDPSAAPNHS